VFIAPVKQLRQTLRHPLRDAASGRVLPAATLGALTIHALALHWGPTQFVLRVEPLENRPRPK
jgi:hypothetical protein